MFSFLLLSSSDILKQILNSSLSDSYIFTLLINNWCLINSWRWFIILRLLIIISFHSKCFTRPCLPICKNCSMVSLKYKLRTNHSYLNYFFNQITNAKTFVNVCLFWRGWKHFIKSILSFLFINSINTINSSWLSLKSTIFFNHQFKLY